VGSAGEASVDLSIVSVPQEYSTLIGQLGVLRPTSHERGAMVEAAIRVWRRPGFDTFASVSNLPFEPFDHQLRAASVVLQRMSGRAILADEVGLGKTIEAGTISRGWGWRGEHSRWLSRPTVSIIACHRGERPSCPLVAKQSLPCSC
jgi:hypothetical protein